VKADYHVHSNYSDGSFIWSMCRAAEEAGLDAVGIADHCNVSTDDRQSRRKKAMGFNLDLTYERRHGGIEAVRESFDLRVFDAVEMDYEPDDEDAVREFLGEAGFEYAVGSVHVLDRVNVHVESHSAPKSEAERRDLVDRYFEKLVALAESELFEIAAHPDIVERNPALRGLATEDHYRRAAEAFADSRTVPEINAGRALGDYGRLHPNDAFLDVLLEHGVGPTVGTDSHEPAEIEPRVKHIEAELEERGIEPVEVVGT
jgi:histidinol-phosphatase (PHP family)